MRCSLLLLLFATVSCSKVEPSFPDLRQFKQAEYQLKRNLVEILVYECHRVIPKYSTSTIYDTLNTVFELSIKAQDRTNLEACEKPDIFLASAVQTSALIASGKYNENTRMKMNEAVSKVVKRVRNSMIPMYHSPSPAIWQCSKALASVDSIVELAFTRNNPFLAPE